MSNKKVSFWRIFFPSLIAGIVLILLFFFIFTGMIGALISSRPVYSVRSNTILHLQLKGKIGEISKTTFSPTQLSVTRDIGLADIQYGLQKAATDPRIKGVFIELDGANCGYTTASDIRKAIKQFEKKSKKFVIAYNRGEVVSLKEYYIASAATKNYGFHSSMFDFLGLGGQLMFYKGLFDKLDVKVQIVRGPNNVYKSAVEPYFRKSMSDSSRMQTQVYLNNIWNVVKARISKDRNIPVQELNTIADSSLATRVSQAVKYHLMDDTLYRDEVLHILAEKVGVKDIDKLQLEDFSKYAGKAFEKQQNSAYNGDANVAVIVAQGDISTSGTGISSERIIQQIRKARKDKNIKIIVLRVNSPGGSALASDEIWRAVKLANEKKKVIVSMGDVAASGGYYISSAATKIFAEKTTITGSIGVFGVIPYTGDFLTKKLGITFDQVSTNPHAVISLNRELTPDEIATVQKGVTHTYHEFLRRVADGRGMTTQQVDKIARGRVWTGEDALKIGLVDTLGGLPDAIHYAEKIAHIDQPVVRFYPHVQTEPWMEVVESLNKNSTHNESVMPAELKTLVKQLKQVKEVTGIQARMAYPVIH